MNFVEEQREMDRIMRALGGCCEPTAVVVLYRDRPAPHATGAAAPTDVASPDLGAGDDKLEQLRNFVVWERHHSPDRKHIAEWALERIEALTQDIARLARALPDQPQSTITGKAAALAAEARSRGLVLTIEQQPTPGLPPAMGRHVDVVSVREVRK